MVLMHRKDIIEQYGFDPANNSSVVPKSEGPTAPIDVVPDDQKIGEPSSETPTATNPFSNLAAGPLKSLTAEPMQLYGLASALAYWGWQKAKGNKDAAFMEGRYTDGGVERVKEHLDNYTARLQEEHPDWSPTAITDEVTRYQATPDFFEFNTGEMIPAMRSGLRLAYDINKATGVNKTPEQESMLDSATQLLGSLIVPTGWLKLALVGGKIAGKVGRIAGHVLDFTVVPGVAGAPTAGKVAGNLGVGLGLSEATRQLSGEPALLPLGGPSALAENFKEQGRVPVEPALDTPFDPQDAQEQAGITPEQKEAFVASATAAGIPTEMIGALGVVAGVAALRHGLRGKYTPNPAPKFNPVGPSERMEARRIRETGLGPEVDPDPTRKAIQYVDEKMDLNAPAYQFGRDLGIEQQLQNALGHYLSPHGQQLTVKSVWEDGVLPVSGERVTPLKSRFDFIASADPQLQEDTKEALKGLSILSEIERARHLSHEEMLGHARYLKNKPNDPEGLAAYTDAQARYSMWQNYDYAVRRYEPDKTYDHWTNAVNKVISSPEGLKQLENYKEIVTTINAVLREGGLMTDAEFHRRLKEEPYHVALYEYDPKLKQKYDPTLPRGDRVLRFDQKVDHIDSPFATAKNSFEIAARAASNMIGRRDAIEAFAARDLKGQEVQIMFPAMARDIDFGYDVKYKDRDGREWVAKFAKKSVADALNQAPIDDGIHWAIINAVRNVSQHAMVGALAGLYQAPRSLFFNVVTGYLGQRSGTSIGYISRYINARNLNDNPFLLGAADAVDALDLLTRPVAYGVTAAQAAALATAKKLGRAMGAQGIQQDGLFGVIARSIPDGERVVADLGERIYTHYTASWLAHYDRWASAGIHASLTDQHAIRDATIATRDKFKVFEDSVQRDLRQWANGTPRGFAASWGGLKPIYHGYMSMLSTVAELHNMTHVAQNLAIEEARLGRPLSLKESRTIAEQARTSAGDMSAQPGGTLLRKYSKGANFGRIAIASTRYLTHALTSRGPWGSGLVAARMAGVVGAMYMSQKAIEDMGLTDWYYEQLNDFQRTGTLRVPVLGYFASKFLGKQYQPDMENPEKNFYTLQLPGEAMAFLGTMMYGLEQAGFVNRGSNRGNTSAQKDLLLNMLQTLNAGNIPLLSAGAAAVFGKKLDLTAGLRGRDALSPIGGSKGQLGDMPSGIPSVVGEVVKSLLGFTGQAALQALDAGAQDYKKTHDMLHATYRGWDELSGTFKDKTLNSIPGLWDAPAKHYNFSAMSTESSRIINVAKQLNDAYTNNFTGAGAMRGENRAVIKDEEILSMLAVTHAFFDRGGLPKLQKVLTSLRNEVDDIEASKATRSYAEVQTAKENMYKQIKPWYEVQRDLIGDYERLLTQEYGDRFRKEGLEPNIDNAAKLIRKYSG
jgi:hypothetical protein